MKTYHVQYKMHSCDTVKGIDIVAKNKVDAYDKTVYEQIPEIEKSFPYSAWVVSVTYNNGSYKQFDTFEGKPY